ncbi:DUF4346 domain-containing protein [Caldinitratiruptor microaerophilus]|uniref:DUF4346 domain-containing protein n=1 Tax=Caldinitratiruptor microaerophilus TaxID=671077 RepID=A0AA35CKG4_9FIRM|nr:hypothetical protein [Caldinitratiruptor microaerophilus]BDG58976.1 hypothetical protein caldi_00660 [Caldinitratiruptor microaerophilus]
MAAADPAAGACIGLAGPLVVGDHGVERLAWALLDRPSLRFLVVAGAEAPDRRVAGALRDLWAGRWRPPNLSEAEVAALRQQVELVDRAGLTDPAAVAGAVRSCAARNPGRWQGRRPPGLPVEVVDAGEPKKCFLAPDPDGYFLLSVDRPARRLVLERFTADGRRTHVLRGTTADAVAAALVRLGLVRDPGHALYLGRELQKAEVALALGLAYEQDVPLRLETQ